MQRRFLINLFFLLFLNFLIKPFYVLGIDAEMINAVGTENYGNYTTLFSFSFLLSVVLDLGINNYNTKNIAQHEVLLSKYFSHLIGIKSVLVVIYIALTILAGLLWGYNANQLHLLLVLAFNQGLAAIILYLRSNLAGLHMFWQDSIVSVLDRLLLIIFSSVLLWGNFFDTPITIKDFVYAQTLAYFISFVFVLFWVWKKSSFVRPKLNSIFSIAIFKKSYPYALLVLLMTFYYKSDTIMLQKMLPDGNQQAGFYAQAYRFFEAGNMVAYLFASLLFPMFSRMLKNKEDISQLVKMSFQILFSGAMIVALSALFFGEEILMWRYDELHPDSELLFAVLMMCFVCIATTYIFGTLLTANEDLKFLNKLALIAMILNIVLNLVLIPEYKALGSAFASLITQLLVSIAQIIVSIKRFSFKISFVFYSKMLGFLALLLVIGYGTKIYFSNWAFGILSFALLSFITALTLKTIPLMEIKKIVNKEY
jgi:O-antigen/teichoic acid export membrane protein